MATKRILKKQEKNAAKKEQDVSVIQAAAKPVDTSHVKTDKTAEAVEEASNVQKVETTVKEAAKKLETEVKEAAIKVEQEAKEVAKKAGASAKKATKEGKEELKESAKKAVKEVKDKKPRKTSVKKEICTQVFVQHNGREVNVDDLVKQAKTHWTKGKNKIGDIKEMKIYVKPEDNAAYYVINEDFTGKIDF